MDLTTIKKEMEVFKQKQHSSIAELSETAEKILIACSKTEESWSGSLAGYHGRLYYLNFQAPKITDRFSVEWGCIHGLPEGWGEKTAEQVKKHIENLTGGVSLDVTEKKTNNLKKVSQKLQEEIAIAFSGYSFSKAQDKEKQLLEQIEKHSLGEKKELFIAQRISGQFITRDSEAAMQGRCTPSHIYYEGIAREAESFCEAIENLLALAERLIRQMEMKMGREVLISEKGLEKLHPEIHAKCNLLYINRAYAEAVEKSFKVVKDKLRALTGYEKASDAFGKTKIFIMGAAAPNVEDDFNEGVKFLTMAIDKFRNEKSHTSNAKIDEQSRAYEYLGMSSLAMHLLENAVMR